MHIQLNTFSSIALKCFIFAQFVFFHAFLKADVPAEVQAVFVNNGCLNCHGNSGGLSLADAATSEAQLVDVDANCNVNEKRVVPGEPDNSVLYQKISQNNPNCGGVMPPNGGLISVADRNTIYDWIISIGPAAQFGLIEMESAAVTAQEPDPEVTVTVNRTLGTQGQVSVDYAVATIGTDTAISPDDYIADASTLVFADGESSKTITVMLADDDVFEGSEVFSVTLSNVVNGAVLGSQTQTKVTIVDNEFQNDPGTFFFNRVSYNIDENAGSLNMTILRSFGGAGEVTVNLQSTGGSAVSGTDFETFSQTLVFAEGVQSMDVSVNILDDQEVEGSESFSLALSNPTNGALLGSPSSVSVTINDDESADNGGGDDGDGGDGGDGDGDGSDDGSTGFEAPEEEQYEAAGALNWILLGFFLFVAITRRHKRA